MTKYKNQRLRSLSGFTLIELVIVVVILGILAGFAIPNYQKSIDKAHERDMAGQLTVLHAANAIYRAHDGTYWISAANPENDLPDINAGLGINIISNDGTAYSYSRANDGSTFTATAAWGIYTIRVTEGSVDTDGTAPDNPCCFTSNCPSVINC